MPKGLMTWGSAENFNFSVFFFLKSCRDWNWLPKEYSSHDVIQCYLLLFQWQASCTLRNRHNQVFQIRRLRPTEVKSFFKVKQLVSRQTRIRVQASWLGHLKEFLIWHFPLHNSGMSPILRYYAACLASQKQPTYTSLHRQGRTWGYGG